MPLGTWEPAADAAAQHITIEAQTLQRLIALSRDGPLEQLPQLLQGDDSQRLAGLMTIDHADWLPATADLSSDELLHLIRFFAVAENLPGWEAGARSPVIPLAKTLRKRGEKLSKELLLWLREVNDNRFLPYGPL